MDKRVRVHVICIIRMDKRVRVHVICIIRMDKRVRVHVYIMHVCAFLCWLYSQRAQNTEKRDAGRLAELEHKLLQKEDVIRSVVLQH